MEISKSDCRDQIITLDKMLNDTYDEYVIVSQIEGKEHSNAFHRYELMYQERQKLFEACFRSGVNKM